MQHLIIEILNVTLLSEYYIIENIIKSCLSRGQSDDQNPNIFRINDIKLR